MQKPSNRSVRSWWWMLALAAAAAAVLIGAVVLRDDDNGGSTTADIPTEIAHIHGLGRNPADNQLYVATHFGLFTIDDDGTAQRVGTNAQDDMGFTIVAADRFLASGHPDFGQDEDAHPLMGLIESSDGGQSWTTRSLEGEADFHALVGAHDQIYGSNSSTGDFMVSRDGEEWERRSQVALLSFAVDPSDPDRVVGSDEDGLLTSDDGGRTWQQAEGPAAAYLSWNGAVELWAAGLDGRVQVSADGGTTWDERTALPGGAAAIVADSGNLYAATDTAQIVMSPDGAQTWTSLYEP